MTDSIFEYDCYRDVIKHQSVLHNITSKSISSAVQIHSSYFSRVMKGKADFSDDQLYKIAKVLKLKDVELDFFLSLGSLSRSSHFQYRRFCEEKVGRLRRTHLKVSGRLKRVDTDLSEKMVATYYEEAVTAKIHMYFTIEKYRVNPGLICRRLHLSEVKFQNEMIKYFET